MGLLINLGGEGCINTPYSVPSKYINIKLYMIGQRLTRTSFLWEWSPRLVHFPYLECTCFPHSPTNWHNQSLKMVCFLLYQVYDTLNQSDCWMPSNHSLTRFANQILFMLFMLFQYLFESFIKYLTMELLF